MSGVSKPYSELYSPVRNDAPTFICGDDSLKILARCKIGYRSNQKTFFSDVSKKPVKGWDRCFEAERGITFKSNISIVSVYLQ
jgi:hypothetical protein